MQGRRDWHSSMSNADIKIYSDIFKRQDTFRLMMPIPVIFDYQVEVAKKVPVTR